MDYSCRLRWQHKDKQILIIRLRQRTLQHYNIVRMGGHLRIIVSERKLVSFRVIGDDIILSSDVILVSGTLIMIRILSI